MGGESVNGNGWGTLSLKKTLKKKGKGNANNSRGSAGPAPTDWFIFGIFHDTSNQSYLLFATKLN